MKKFIMFCVVLVWCIFESVLVKLEKDGHGDAVEELREAVRNNEDIYPIIEKIMKDDK